MHCWYLEQKGEQSTLTSSKRVARLMLGVTWLTTQQVVLVLLVQHGSTLKSWARAAPSASRTSSGRFRNMLIVDRCDRAVSQRGERDGTRKVAMYGCNTAILWTGVRALSAKQTDLPKSHRAP